MQTKGTTPYTQFCVETVSPSVKVQSTISMAVSHPCKGSFRYIYPYLWMSIWGSKNFWNLPLKISLKHPGGPLVVSNLPFHSFLVNFVGFTQIPTLGDTPGVVHSFTGLESPTSCGVELLAPIKALGFRRLKFGPRAVPFGSIWPPCVFVFHNPLGLRIYV